MRSTASARPPAIRAGAEPFRFGARSDAACLLVHGWAGSPSELRPLGRHLAEAGVTALGVRLPGHGTSVEDFARASWRDWLAAVETAYREARSEFARVFLCGFSLGGTLALHIAAHHALDPHLGGLVTINAPVTTPRWYLSLRHLRSLLLPGQIEEAQLPLAGLEDARAVYYPNPPLRAALQARRLILATRRRLPEVRQPLLVIQSRQDRSINARDAERIGWTVASAEKRIVWLEDSYHLTPLDGDAPRVRQAVLAFLETKVRSI